MITRVRHSIYDTFIIYQMYDTLVGCFVAERRLVLYTNALLDPSTSTTIPGIYNTIFDTDMQLFVISCRVPDAYDYFGGLYRCSHRNRIPGT